jgi:hypothetical protein
MTVEICTNRVRAPAGTVPTATESDARQDVDRSTILIATQEPRSFKINDHENVCKRIIPLTNLSED